MKKTFAILIIPAIILSSCNQQDAVLNVDYLQYKTKPTEIDSWISENYVDPFNIEVKYKWDPYELALNKVLVPPKEEMVIPVMDMVKKTWINPYVNVAGADFMKIHAPKQFVLVGSPQYNNDGTIVLGEAESGRKVTLFLVNYFVRTDKPAVKQMLHTIHHEFAHILHQTVLYPREFKQITSFGYTATWYNTSDQSALDLGFITPYARAGADEDFVEMISTMLVEGKTAWKEKLNNASPQGKAYLKQKEQVVVAYFKESWGIDFYNLQQLTQQAIEEATN
jgi:substrate import-associated zinc metallohydrolase lipoprotein